MARKLDLYASGEKEEIEEKASKDVAIEEETSENNLDEDSNKDGISVEKRLCCAGDYCWKMDDPKKFIYLCRSCDQNCHVYCSKRNKDGDVICQKCFKENL